MTHLATPSSPKNCRPRTKIVLGTFLGLVLAVGARATPFTFTPSPADLNDLAHSSAYTWGITGSSETSLRNQLTSGGESIVSATLSIANLYNWDTADTENQLFMHLLDNSAAGVKTITDDPTDTGVNRGVVSDYFDGTTPGNDVGGKWVAYGYKNTRASSAGVQVATGATNIYLTQYHDPDGPATSVNWTFNFSAADLNTLTSYILDGHTGGSGYADFGLGFDPDCHFFNSGVTLTIDTGVVPPPPPPPVSVPDRGMTLALLAMGLVAMSCFSKAQAAKTG